MVTAYRVKMIHAGNKKAPKWRFFKYFLFFTEFHKGFKTGSLIFLTMYQHE